jgi:hypothetical protein
VQSGQRPLVSIVLPVYNEVATLPELLARLGQRSAAPSANAIDLR